MNRRAAFATLAFGLPLLALTAGRTDYPAYVRSKTLYAKHDLRGKKAPKITAQRWLTGKLPSLKGKVVLVDIWATWCPPCRETIPELGEWQKKFSKDLVVIGISDESAQTVSDFMKKTPMPYNVGVDSKKAVDTALGVEGIPHIIVFTPDGIVRWQGFPLDDGDPLTAKKLDQIIKASKKQ